MKKDCGVFKGRQVATLTENEGNQIPEVITEEKVPRKRKDDMFAKDEWRIEQDDNFYTFIRKYYKGPKFRSQIKLTKNYWSVTEGDKNFLIEKVKK